MTRGTTLFEFEDLQATVKAVWNSNQSIYDIICGATYIGSAESLDLVEPAFRNWFANICK